MQSFGRWLLIKCREATPTIKTKAFTGSGGHRPVQSTLAVVSSGIRLPHQMTSAAWDRLQVANNIYHAEWNQFQTASLTSFGGKAELSPP